MGVGEFEGDGDISEEDAMPEIESNGASVKSSEGEAKVDDGNIQEAESSLKEGLSLNYEEARALLGRLEYQKGNIEAALRVFDGIDLQASVQRLQSSQGDQSSARKGRPGGDSVHSSSQHAASLVLEAIYLKSLSLRKLGKAKEAAQECQSILDAVEKMFQPGIPDLAVDQKLQETVSRSVELLPELWKEAESYQEALASYRRALLSHWNLDDEYCARIQKRFAVFLLYGGVEVSAPSLASQIEGSFVPKNNLEEAMLLLFILLRTSSMGKTRWDPSVMEHLSFALTVCGQTSVLAKHFEEIMPGVYPRCDRWYNMALCYCAAGQNFCALNLMRKSLHKDESPNDVMTLLLAAKICSGDCLLSPEGVEYARRAIVNAQAADEHLKSVGLRFLGICLGKKSKIASSDNERSSLQREALKSLDEAFSIERHNADILFDLGLEYAEQRNTNSALRCIKEYIDATGGSILKGWSLLVLVLSAQQRYSEAEIVTDAALDETGKWEQGPLLRIKAKLKVAQSLPMDAIEAYRFLLALVQAQRKSFGSFKNNIELEDDKVSEFEVWQGLGNLYSSLSHWGDAEICLDKARALKPFAASIMHTEGHILEANNQMQQALVVYCNAVSTEPNYVPCKVAIGALLSKKGSKCLPVARSILSDALRLEPTNRLAWYHMGIVHRDEGRLTDAADCFQAASLLEESDSIESFSSIQ